MPELVKSFAWFVLALLRLAGAAVADSYRLKDGKIVEHWDILQPVSAQSANPHPMF